MRRITLHTFRQVSRAEELMIRAAMPRISAADPIPLPAFAAPLAGESLRRRSVVSRGWQEKTAFTLAEAVHV